MSEMTRQEREALRYQAQVRTCAMCRGEYSGGSYAEHREGEEHQRFLRLRANRDDLMALPAGTILAGELASSILGRQVDAMLVRDVLALL